VRGAVAVVKLATSATTLVRGPCVPCLLLLLWPLVLWCHSYRCLDRLWGI
jgi:hypothetical protein